MRILHTSDWHLGRNLEQINRIAEQREFIDCLCKTVEENKIDLILVAGDIYDTYNPSAAAEELFYEAMDRLNDNGRRAVVVIAGNHDNPERLCAASPLVRKRGIILLGYPGSDVREYLPGSDVCEFIPRSDTHEYLPGNQGSEKAANSSGKAESVPVLSGIHIANSGPGWLELCIRNCGHHAVIITMPYPSESRLEEVLSQEADESILQKAYSDKIGSIFATLGSKFRDDTVNLIVAHLFLLGGSTSDSERTLQVGGAMTVNPGIMPDRTHFVALGHLHRPQEIRSANCPVYYAGSPLAYSFSEADYSKAVYIVDALPGEKAVVTPFYLDCGKPLRKWVADKGIGQAIKWCEEGRDPNAWIDLEIVTDRILTAEEQKKLRSLNPGIINIRPRLKSDETEAISPKSREGRKIDELFSDFYKYRMGAEIPDELMGAFLEILSEEEERNVENECDGEDAGLGSDNNEEGSSDTDYTGGSGKYDTGSGGKYDTGGNGNCDTGSNGDMGDADRNVNLGNTGGDTAYAGHVADSESKPNGANITDGEVEGE